MKTTYIVPMQWCVIAILLVLLLSGCSTDAGKRTAGYAVADLGSTGLILTAVEGAVEANPLGWWMIPGKYLATKWVDGMPCQDQVNETPYVAGIWGGATANNLMILVYPPAAIPVGIATGITLGIRDKEIHKYDCNLTPDQFAEDLLYFTDAPADRVRFIHVNDSPDALRYYLRRDGRDNGNNDWF